MKSSLTITFENETIEAQPGMSVAAALTAAGHRRLRTTDGQAERGIFCGMGVCQDCLVEIDGVPNTRACMTKVREGMSVMRQCARPSLQARGDDTAPDAKMLEPDVLVIGGGPAGMTAAIAAATSGARTILMDERSVSGGQFYKQSGLYGVRPLDAQQADGARLYERLLQSAAAVISNAEVWGAFDGPVVLASTPERVYTVRPGKLIVATGAYERPLMIPGWTLPGVMTAGAAQTLWRSYRVPAGKRVAIFGNGPLNAQVALELAEGGAEISLLAEAAPHPAARPGRALAMLASDTRLAGKGMAMLARLRKHGVSTNWNTLPLRIEPTEDGCLQVTYRRSGIESSVMADTVCMNFGFQPQNEILRLLGARMTYDAHFAQLRTNRSETMETTVANVYAVGDCCGLGGAPAALIEGEIAGLAAAGRTAPRTDLGKKLRDHRRFQEALWQTYAADIPQMKDAEPETPICRCEEVRKADLDAALATNPTDIGAVKRATRIGMGRCQGRYCSPALAECLSHHTGEPVGEFSFFAPRVPVKPVRISVVAATELPASDSVDD